MKTKTKIIIQNILLILVVFFSSNYLNAQENSGTHFIGGIIGSPPTQYEFRNWHFRPGDDLYLTSFPLDTIKDLLGEEVLNEVNVDYWIHTKFNNVELAMVEKMELLSLSLKNSINFPLDDGEIGDNCWHSIEEKGTLIFSRNNAMVFITPKEPNSIDSEMIETSARKIDSVLIHSDKVSQYTDVPAPNVLNIETKYYPRNWDDTLKVSIDATDTASQKLYFRKYGDDFDLYSTTGNLTTTLNRNSDQHDIKIWVWNENHVATIINPELSFAFMNYPVKYMLTENDISGYNLDTESRRNWGVGEIEPHEGIHQRWKKSGTDNDQIARIEYHEFDSEQQAITGTSYAAHNHNDYLFYGSFTEELKGNLSYVPNDYYYSYYIQKWNIGINLGLANISEEDRSYWLNSIDKILTKINDSIPESYKIKDRELRLNQIKENDFNQIAAGPVSLLTHNNYTEFKTDDTKWVYSSDSLIMGLRKQWRKENSLFSIDMVKLSNKTDAELIAKKKDTITNTITPILLFNDRDSINYILERFNIYSYSTNYYTAIGISGNYVIFFHYQHEDIIDIDFLKSIILSFVDTDTGITNFKQNNIQIYPNPANETLTIETQNPETTFAKLLDSTGRFLKTLPIENGTNTNNISELESGVYFIQVLQNEKMVVRKFVKN